jgi:hypothetical protein
MSRVNKALVENYRHSRINSINLQRLRTKIHNFQIEMNKSHAWQRACKKEANLTQKYKKCQKSPDNRMMKYFA